MERQHSRMIDPSSSDNETNKILDESDLSHVFEKSKNCSSSCVSSAIFSKHGEESPVKKDNLAQSKATITNRDQKKVKHNSCFNSNSNHGDPSKDTELLSQPESSLPDQKSKKGKTMKGKDKIPISQIVKKFPRNAVIPQSSKLNYSQKNAHVTTSYWNRKKGLNKHRVGRPRKDFDQCKIDAKKSNPPMLNDPSSVENIVSATCIDTHESPGRNSRTKMKNKRLRGHEDSGDCHPGKQIEASVIEDGSKKKRGRPKFIKKPSSTISKEEKFALAMKKVSVKTKGRSKNFIPIKMSSRPKSPRNAALLGVTVGQIVSGAFVQHVNCLNDKMKIPKCRECRQAAYNRSTWSMSNSYCRFLEYRKLFIDIDGSILLAGFLQPLESTDNDKSLWLPNVSFPPKDLTRETSKELLIQVGDQFCDLVQQEKDAVSLHMGPDKNITWKKLVPGVREMCDVCETTLFNIHWVCHKCGFAVCIDCYKVRKQGVIIDEGNHIKGRDDYLWFSCHNRVPHEQDQMMMAQMVPGNALWSMNEIMHRVREEVNIPAYCKCAAKENMSTHKNSVTTGICKQLMSHVSKSFATINCLHTNNNDSLSICAHNLNIKVPTNALQWVQQWEKADSKSNELAGSRLSPEDANGLEFITQNQTGYNVPMHEYHKLIIKAEEGGCGEVEKPTSDTLLPLNNRYPKPSGGRKPLPVRIFTSVESEMLFKNQCHSWLCHGRLLLLHQPDHEGNLEVFREQWKRGQPIMVARVDRKLDMSLWHPSGFCRDFGDIVNDLVNCQTGAVIRNLPMSKFWLGFENLDQRMKDDSGEYMLLKLKDWPPGEDFSEKLPKRFHDLMKGLPLPEYTHRNGIFNLAGRLPSWFVRPDLGPKMYNAYGSALYPTKGTTNLHLDISDAVNVMVYVGVPHDGKDEEHIFQALKAIDEGGCDSLTRERVRSKGVKPGALWHIYDYRSVDKIRDFLTKVAIERGEKLEAHHDPIHDQSWYLDTELRRRLFAEYGVQGYAIAQCLGDAVFIPAGAPHQVRNLHSCVKVAEDFVSPENIAHCFKLTQEFRHLSDTHTNHEDKLQIKNIIYHVVKDALSHLIKK